MLQQPCASDKIIKKQSSNSCNTLSHFYEKFLSKENVTADKVKRPMSSFLLWAKITRKKYSKENPHMHNSEISKLLGFMWNQMSSIEKLPFTIHAENLRTVHMTNHPKYRYSSKKFKYNKINYSEMAVAQRNNFLDVNDFVNKSITNNDISRNQNLNAYGYLQNACFAQHSAEETECISSNNAVFSDIDFNRNQNMVPLNKESYGNFSENVKFSIESKKEDEKTTTATATLHYHPNQIQLHFDNQYQNSNGKEASQTYEIETNTDVVEYDNELMGFFQSLEF